MGEGKMIDEIATNVVLHDWIKGHLNMGNLMISKNSSIFAFEDFCALLFGTSAASSPFLMELS